MISSRAAIVEMLADWDTRLAVTPAGTPALLLAKAVPKGVSARRAYEGRDRNPRSRS
jgi:hypothetical protein